MKNLTLLFILAFLYGLTVQAQVRGALPGEIYISGITYIGYEGQHYAVFYSSNNGETMTLQYKNFENQSGVMWVGDVLGDATPGAIYNNYFYGTNELWVSFDYGVNWQEVDNFGLTPTYTSGCLGGEIYRCCADVQGTIWRSTDFGNNFEEVRDGIKIKLEVDVTPGNVYGFANYPYPQVGYYLSYSNDYALNFIEIPIDSAVAFWQIAGIHPKISRGTEPGELYLVSWWPDYHYKIFHSTDTGYTWTQKFESGFIDIYDWSVSYTAGRQPGSFYVTRSTYDPTHNHRLLYIDYSDDYGETFTTYFHELDSLFTAVAAIHKTDFRLSAYPNPFSGNTTIVFDVPENWKVPVLNIYNIYGEFVRQFTIKGKRSLLWDGRDEKGTIVPGGIYLYNISYDNNSLLFNKLIFIN